MCVGDHVCDLVDQSWPFWRFDWYDDFYWFDLYVCEEVIDDEYLADSVYPPRSRLYRGW